MDFTFWIILYIVIGVAWFLVCSFINGYKNLHEHPTENWLDSLLWPMALANLLGLLVKIIISRRK